MIKHKTIIRSTVSFFLGAAFSISAFAAPSDDFFTPLNLGPGFDSLSQNDEYASYQWGLKNDGQFQLVRMIASFQSLDSVYGLEGLEGGNHAHKLELPVIFQSFQSVDGI